MNFFVAYPATLAANKRETDYFSLRHRKKKELPKKILLQQTELTVFPHY